MRNNVSGSINTELNITTIIDKLAKKRPIFHSEADIQHAFAWEIHEQYPLATVRLEVPSHREDKKEHIDIWIKYNDKIHAIELKYKTRKIDVTHLEETFYLLNHYAQDWGRYDFLKDIVRLESFNVIGYAIMLTNDDRYWQKGRRATIDTAFRIHEGRTIEGTLTWGENAAEGTTRGRTDPLQLRGIYSLQWRDYSNLQEAGPNQFRCLVLKVLRQQNLLQQE